MPSVLIVDDLLSIHEMLEAVIQPTGFLTSFTTDGEKALALYKAEKFDLVLADIDMKPMDGITLLKQIKLYDPNTVVIIMTAYASTESAVQALKYGAFDYLQKPFRVDELIATLKRGLEFKRFHADRAASSGAPTVRPGDIDGRIVGQSAPVKKLIQQINKLVTVRTPVLLSGEAGTGKRTVAEVLHAVANPADVALVAIDCAISSEDKFRVGLLGDSGEGGAWIKQAKGGTLLLHHVQCLSSTMQKELVSVLRNTAHGFRLICTTTEDLERLTDEGKFNDELFYRVASLPVQIPPLRQRTEDIPLLAKHFAAKATNPHFDANLVEFSDESIAVLSVYHWPGNIAELSQVVTKIVSTAESRVVGTEQLPVRLRELKHWPSLAEYLAEQEKQYIEMVLRASRGDKASAAKLLGVDLTRLDGTG